METFVYQIKSAKGVHLEQLHQEIIMITDKYRSDYGIMKIKLVPAANCILLTSDNLRLRATLLKDDDFILT